MATKTRMPGHILSVAKRKASPISQMAPCIFPTGAAVLLSHCVLLTVIFVFLCVDGARDLAKYSASAVAPINRAGDYTGVGLRSVRPRLIHGVYDAHVGDGVVRVGGEGCAVRMAEEDGS